MAALNLDFSNVASREPLDPGFYTVRISESELTESSTKKPMLKLTYDVLGDADGNPVEGNRKLWDNCVLTDNALWKIKNLFSALELDTSAIVDMDTDELIGMEMGVKVTIEPYQGENRNQVKAYKSMEAMSEM